jgi:hypothetical protein
MTQMLTRHRDIQNWVSDRKGIPAIARVRNRFGQERAQLRLSFRSPDRDKADLTSQDDGVSPCSWNAWLAELDRQHLALRVDPAQDGCELVERREAH